MTIPPSIAGFESLRLSPAVLSAVKSLGYEIPTAIQTESIPYLLEGRDLLGQAQTGTGKTAAFALPLLSRIDVALKQPQVLVLTPTRELALQVSEAFQSYAHHLPNFHVLPLYGGQNMSLQLRQLRRGAQIIIGTPGRVMDHLRRQSLSLEALQALVLDEADEMLKMGFIDDIEWIFEQAPAQRQVALFSATLSEPIRRVARKRLHDPVEIKVKVNSQIVPSIDQYHCVVTRSHKLDALTRLLEVEEFDAMIIFLRTKTATLEMAEKLQAHGFAAEALNGDLNQVNRERIIERLKKGSLDILVATDIAARGLHVERITHVINYDIPNDPESYVHRIGRTGRAGRKGKAMLFIQPRERNLLKAIERTIHQPIPAITLPSVDDLNEHRIDQFMGLLRQTLAEQDLDFYYRLIARIEQEQEISVTDIAAALTFLNQRDRPFLTKERLTGRHSIKPTVTPNSRRAEKEKREQPRRKKTLQLQRYRIEVGRNHRVTPRDIVGAIANEAGLEGHHIGSINIHDGFSFVELPIGMPKEIYRHLRKVIVCGQPLKIQLEQKTATSEPATHTKQINSKRKQRRKKQRNHTSSLSKRSAAQRTH